MKLTAELLKKGIVSKKREKAKKSNVSVSVLSVLLVRQRKREQSWKKENDCMFQYLFCVSVCSTCFFSLFEVVKIGCVSPNCGNDWCA